MRDVLDWFIPPTDHDPVKQYMWRVRIAFFGCIAFFGVSLLYVGLLFEWGPAVIRPASANAVVLTVGAATVPIQRELETLRDKTIADLVRNQLGAIKDQRTDRIERLDQQLLWYRQQNCRMHGAAKGYAWSKMNDLRAKYHDLTSQDWTPPTCAEIGD